VAGDVFQLDDEGKAIVVGPVKDEKNVLLAAEACPVRAIFIYDDNKKQLYPDPQDYPRPYLEK
jgi:ferredoxin